MVSLEYLYELYYEYKSDGMKMEFLSKNVGLLKKVVLIFNTIWYFWRTPLSSIKHTFDFVYNITKIVPLNCHKLPVVHVIEVVESVVSVESGSAGSYVWNVFKSSAQ